MSRPKQTKSFSFPCNNAVRLVHECQRQCDKSKLASNAVSCSCVTYLQPMEPLCSRQLLRNQGCLCQIHVSDWKQHDHCCSVESICFALPEALVSKRYFLEIVPLVEGDQIGHTHTHKVPWFGAKRQHLQYFEKAFDIEWLGAANSTLEPHAKRRGQKKNISHSTSVYITLYVLHQPTSLYMFYISLHHSICKLNAEASVGCQGKEGHKFEYVHQYAGE